MLRIICVLIFSLIFCRAASAEPYIYDYGHWLVLCADTQNNDPEQCYVAGAMYVSEGDFSLDLTVLHRRAGEGLSMQFLIPPNSSYENFVNDQPVGKHILIFTDTADKWTELPVTCEKSYCETNWIGKTEFPKKRLLISLAVGEEGRRRVVSFPLEGFAEAINDMESRIKVPSPQ